MTARLRSEILSLLERQEQERRDISRARGLLRKRDLGLYVRGGRCLVIDHLGPVAGAPGLGSAAEVLAWITATEADQ